MTNPMIEKTVTMPRFSFDVRCARDSVIAGSYYDDFVTNAGDDCPVLRLGGDFYVIGDYEKPYYKKSELIKMKKADLVALADNILNYEYYRCDYSELKKADIIADLLEFTYANYYQHNVSEYSWFNREYSFIARGYSQGDAVQVTLLPDAPKWVTREYIENLIFNAPVFCRATITDNATGKEYELNLHEQVEDEYEYNQDELLAAAKEEIGFYSELSEYADLIVESIKSLLPDHPDYR